jgi:hypothetical protein
MMACSSTCHKKAKKERRECSKSSLATLQPQIDTDMANAEIAAFNGIERFSTTWTDSAFAQAGYA